MRHENPQGDRDGADAAATASGAPGAERAETADTAGVRSGAEAALDAATVVAAYLHAHPDFLDRHPDLLAELDLPHLAGGGVVSLVERQVRVLRTQLQTERTRLAQLIARARDYEAFSARLHALVLALISATDLAEVQALLQEDLTRGFSAQAVTLRLFPVDAADPRHDRDPVVNAFRDFIERRHALCGPLDEAKNGVLFGTRSPEQEPVRCAALVPIRAHGRCGVLAIGATDPERFRPEMGTDLLDRLGEIVSRKLGVLPAESATATPDEATPGAAPAKPRRTRARRPAAAALPAEAPPPTPAGEPVGEPAGNAAAKPRRRPAKKTVPE